MTASRRVRRAAGLAGLLGTAGLLVAGKAALAPATHRVALAGAPVSVSAGSPTTSPAPVLQSPAVTASPAARAPAHTAAPTTPVPTTPVPTTAAPAPVVRTVLGAAEGNPYGTVQVRLTLDGTRITDVAAVQLPSGGRSSEISAYAAPQLRSEVLAAQSAGIDAVSGASYTSDGYARSVQAALDAARK